MKIVYEAPLFKGVGGGPRHFEGIARGLASHGHGPILVLPKETAVNLKGFRRLQLSSPGSRSVRHLTYEVARALLFLRLIVTGKRFDVWMARHSLFGCSLFLARRVANKVVLEVNGPVREEVELNFGSPVLAAVVDRLFTWQIRAADVVVAVSPGLADYVLARVAGATVRAVPNGAHPVGNDVVALARELPESDLVFSGAVTPWYDMRTVFDALVLLRDDGMTPLLRVVGDGASRESWAADVECRGLNEQVEFLGWVEANEAQAYVLSSRVGILPMVQKGDTVAAVGSPLKLYEYASCGISVVATGLDGTSNSPLADTVFVYNPGDVEGCAAAIKGALETPAAATDPDLWSWEARAGEVLRELGVRNLGS